MRKGGGSPKGAELIAAKWADNRKVPQIAFKPDWTKHAKAAPFRRNDAILEVLPIGVMHFPGTGIQDNLADKAKKLGIPVFEKPFSLYDVYGADEAFAGYQNYRNTVWLERLKSVASSAGSPGTETWTSRIGRAQAATAGV